MYASSYSHMTVAPQDQRQISSTYSPVQLASVNVTTEKLGLTSAIFLSHSEQAPHGLSGFVSLQEQTDQMQVSFHSLFEKRPQIKHNLLGTSMLCFGGTEFVRAIDAMERRDSLRRPPYKIHANKASMMTTQRQSCHTNIVLRYLFGSRLLLCGTISANDIIWRVRTEQRNGSFSPWGTNTTLTERFLAKTTLRCVGWGKAQTIRCRHGQTCCVQHTSTGLTAEVISPTTTRSVSSLRTRTG